MNDSSAFFVSNVRFSEVIVLQTLARYVGPSISHVSGWIPDLRKPDLEVYNFSFSVGLVCLNISCCD